MHAAATQSSQVTIETFKKYVIPNYVRYPVSLVHGEGSYVWDAEEKRYLDLFPGWGCNILGYAPPRGNSPRRFFFFIVAATIDIYALSLQDDLPNVIAPGKRPRITLTPTLV